MFPAMPDTWPATRATLHAYAHAVGVVPRAHAVAHPQWWHISLEVRPNGLTTDTIPTPAGGVLDLRLDLHRHAVVVTASDGGTVEFPLDAGTTATAMGDQIIAAVAGMGLPADGYARDKFENDEPRAYDRAAAEAFFAAAVTASTAFERHRGAHEGPFGPVQLWPHGFDLAVDWYGTRIEEHTEDGETTQYPSQLNLGFYPGAEPYFYSNPWPFDASLMTAELPGGAAWTQESFEGSMLAYDDLVGDPAAADKLLGYAAAVFEAATPTLTA